MTGEKMKECVHRTQMPLLPAQVNRCFSTNQGKQMWHGQTDRHTDRWTDMG